MKRTLLVAALALSSPALLAARARADATTSFEASAPVVNGDTARARERATDDAIQHAVDAAITQALRPVGRAEGPADQQREAQARLSLRPRARTLVESWRVLDEGLAGDVYRVRVEVVVSGNRVMQALGQSLRASAAPAAAGGGSPSRPRVLVCVAGEPHDAADVARRLALAASGRGLEPVSTVELCGGGALDEEALRRTAASEQARAALLGDARTKPEGLIRGTRLFAAHARVALRLVDENARALAAADQDADAWNALYATALDAALGSATDGALARIGPALDEHLAARPSGPSPGGASLPSLTVVLDGVDRYADVEEVLRALGSVPGVASVAPRRFHDGLVEIDLRTDGRLTPQTLAQALPLAAAGRPLERSPSSSQLALRLGPAPLPPSTTPTPGAPPPPR